MSAWLSGWSASGVSASPQSTASSTQSQATAPSPATEPSKPPAAAQAAESSTASSSDAAKGSECPICVMMRQGGCEQQFHAFMDCGADAEKGKREYTDCISMFESMRECMLANPAVFGPMLDGIREDKDLESKNDAA